jgi:hypothetical protein
MADPLNVRGLKRLIALKYERDPKSATRGKPDPNRVRVRDLLRLLYHRMQQSNIPDDWYAWQVHGREISRVIISHLARMPNARERIEEFTARYPGLPQADIDAIIAKPRRWNAEQLGNLLSLTPEERASLRITTIRARATPTREMKPAKRERARLRRIAKRRAKGVKPRAKYESESLSRTQPWEAEGIKRSAWYARRKRKR